MLFRSQHLRSETVVRVVGAVRARPSGTTNADLATGEVEVAVASVEVLAEAEDAPLVGPHPLEYAVAVEEAVVEDAVVEDASDAEETVEVAVDAEAAEDADAKDES